MATWRDRLWRVVVAFLLIFGQLCSDYGNLAAKSSTKGQIIGVPKGRAAAAIPEAHRPHSEQFRPTFGTGSFVVLFADRRESTISEPAFS
jgi:hypothetical protein